MTTLINFLSNPGNRIYAISMIVLLVLFLLAIGVVIGILICTPKSKKYPDNNLVSFDDWSVHHPIHKGRF